MKGKSVIKTKGIIKVACILFAGLLLMGGAAGCADKGQSSSAEESGKAEESSRAEESGKAEESSKAEESVRFPDRANANKKEGKVKVLEVGDVAPDFTATLVDGSTFVLSEHDDEVVLLNFFASWCGPCMREMPAFETLKSDGYENLAILCVNCMEDKKTVDALVKEKKYTFPIAYDEKGVIEAYYPTEGIPYTLVIKQGVISKIYLGARDAETQYREYKGAIDE